jgi:hypothetical protein
MNKKPILILTGLAVAAVAAVAGLTKDRWLAPAPQTVAGGETPKTPEAVASNSNETAAPAQSTAEQPAATAPATGEQPAATAPATGEQPAATAQEQPEPGTGAPAQPAATAEAPAQPAAQQQASTQPEAAPAPAAQPEQPAQPEATEQSAAPQQAPATQPEQSAPASAPAAQQETAASEVPSFDTVRVEKTGEAVIAGTAEAGSEVVVKLDGQAIGKTTANADGAFVLVPDQPLPKGSGALTVEAKGKGDLQATQSEQSVAVIVPAEAKTEALVAVISPNAPTRILQKPQPEPAADTPAPAQPAAQTDTQVASAQPESQAASENQQPAPKPAAIAKTKSVSIDVVDYDSAGNIMFSGQGEPGHTARLYVDNDHAGDAPIGPDGRWSYSGTSSMKTGVHSLRVDGIDTSGKVANRVEVPFFSEEQSKVAAAVPATEQPAGQTTSKTEPVAATVVQEQQSAVTPASEGAVQGTVPREGRVVIQPGNNLWRISRVLYGSGEKYTMLYQANKDQIRNPDLIYPGQIFKTPEVAPKVESIDPKRRDPLKPEENAASAP